MNSSVSNYSVPLKRTDGATGTGESYWYNSEFSKRYGYYESLPELKNSIKGYATWITGQGFDVEDAEIKVILEHLKGWGEDNIGAIFWNMLVMKKVNGDAYAEIMRADDKDKTLMNLKPLSPENVIHVVSPKGMIIGYDYLQADGTKKRLKPEQIFHLVNDRVADNIHGDSVIDAMKWTIDARNEAMADWRRISHRATIRILYIEEDNKTQLANMKRDYADAINKGELLILPVKAGDAQFQDLTLPPYQAFLEWIKYLENVFYQALGIPKVVLGGTADNTEASAKVSYTAWEPFYTREIVDLEADIWNQLGIKITFKKPASFVNQIQTDETKNAGQTGFQPNDTQMGAGK
jgi:hypothetical protein